MSDLDNRFDYHRPDEDKAARHEGIRSACKSLAISVAASVPEGREQALALTKIEEAMFWANAGIARN